MFMISTFFDKKEHDDDSLPVMVKVDDEINEELIEDHGGEKTCWYFVGEDKYLFPSKYAIAASSIHNFECREDDVWIVTFPRSGELDALIMPIMRTIAYHKH